MNAKDEIGITALMLAAHDGHLNVVKFLIDRGADVNAKDKRGYTALGIADNNTAPVPYLIGHVDQCRWANLLFGSWITLEDSKRCEIISYLKRHGAK